MKQTSPKGFSYKTSKDGKLFISRNHKLVMTLKGEKAASIMEELLGCSDEEVQMILAVATGQYRMGNERLGSWKRSQKGH